MPPKNPDEKLTQALQPLPPPEELLEALGSGPAELQALWTKLWALVTTQPTDTLTSGPDLSTLTEREVESDDVVRRARQAYILSYLRIIAFLVQPPQSQLDHFRQATIAMSYVKHIESLDGDPLKLKDKRRLGSEELQKRLKELRTGVMAIREIREERRTIREVKLDE